MKLFREHRGSLYDSLETTIECPNGLNDIIRHFKEDNIMKDYIKHIYIQPSPITDERLPEIWNSTEYFVMANYGENCSACIGFSNFKE